MRVIVVFACVLAMTAAAPQFGYGYNPETATSHRGGDKYLPPSAPTQAPIVHKQFFVISAPEDTEHRDHRKHLVLGRPQKNYRVIFIKAPSSDNANVKLTAEYAPQEEKTVIYVLSKKDNDLEVSDIATPAPTPPSKPEVYFIKYKTQEEAAAAQKEIQDGWQAFRDSFRLQDYEYKKALVHLQVIYGIFPYYKISVENGFNKPHDYIISLDVGEIGLPDKYFYNIDERDEIVHGYKLLLRDFAINMGLVTREADLFADEVFHYEKRIVNHIDSVRSGRVRKLNEIKTLSELRTVAPSLPILESLKGIFPHTKISEDTEVLVRDVEVLHEMSTVLSTSDKKPINNFIIWSLARHLLPHLSKEYRNLAENFDNAVYGRTTTYPRWLFCSKIVRDWLPFAVDALQQHKSLLKPTLAFRYDFTRSHHKSFPNKTHGNAEFLRLMFYSLRNQLQTSVEQAPWIDAQVKKFINEKLTTMRLQIGIPEEALATPGYIKDYYNELLLNNLFFVDHLEAIWSFRKARMEKKLKALNIVDTIISELYTHEEPQSIAYSNILNMLIIARGVTKSQYYDYRFPVPVNFARIGVDILEVLIDTISTFVEQFRVEHFLNMNESYTENFDLAKVNVACITAEEQSREELQQLSNHTLKSFHITLSAAKIAAKALSSFVEAIDSGSPIIGASIDQELTYENLRLTQRHRLPGLRSYNENELFALAYLQKHCSTSIADKDYARIKPHVEQRLAERYLFNATWNHVQFLPLAMSCHVPDVRCPNIL